MKGERAVKKEMSSHIPLLRAGLGIAVGDEK